MTDRGVKNIANASMIVGFIDLLHFKDESLALAIIGAMMILAGMLTQMFFEFKRLKSQPT